MRGNGEAKVKAGALTRKGRNLSHTPLEPAEEAVKSI
jgi:hypothetical protein